MKHGKTPFHIIRLRYLKPHHLHEPNRTKSESNRTEPKPNRTRPIMNQNIISKLNLEPRIADLKRENLSERDIAQTLSKESNQTITRSAVHRYLAGNVRLCQEVVEVNNKIKVKVVEAELDTIEARRELIDKIRDLGDRAEEFGDIKTALYALSQAISALDSLDKRLGKFSASPDINVNIQLNSVVQENQTYQNFMLKKICPACKAVLIQDLEKAV